MVVVLKLTKDEYLSFAGAAVVDGVAWKQQQQTITLTAGVSLCAVFEFSVLNNACVWKVLLCVCCLKLEDRRRRRKVFERNERVQTEQRN